MENYNQPQDYQYLNQKIAKNAYPLPLISRIMDKIKAASAKCFTKLDICWGYDNIRVKEGDEWKAAFKTHNGLFGKGNPVLLLIPPLFCPSHPDQLDQLPSQSHLHPHQKKGK